MSIEILFTIAAGMIAALVALLVIASQNLYGVQFFLAAVGGQ